MEPTPNPRHSVSVAGVILNGDVTRVLLVKRRDNGRWEPPGGVLELGETIEAGLRREIVEETGVEVAVEGLTGAYKNMNQGIVALVFRCQALSAPLPESEEAMAIEWQPIVEVERLMPPAYAIRILDAINDEVASTRAHDGQDLL
jgi:ADP-ribose pyrophosphatase YjhB (NUDIX family)